MKLTTFTDYSLRVLMYAATVPGGRATIAEASRAFGISEHHVVKVVHLLGREGLLRNTRGRGGGFALARPASEINIGKVVRVTEHGDPLAECFREGASDCALAPDCRLADALSQALAAFYTKLEEFTLEDIVAERRRVVAVLHRVRPFATGD